jgi:F0F1-type ATP synthase membrane subunit b/b'
MELLKDIFAQLGINKTLYLQLLLVILVYFLLSRIIFRKILTILLIRKHQVSGMKNMAEMTLFDYDKLSREYTERWQKYEEEAERIKVGSHERSLIEANDLIRKANKETDVFLKEKRSETLKEIRRIEDSLTQDMEAMSKKLEQKLTTRNMVKKA